MILVGLTGWGDHDSLYRHVSSRNKLAEYAAHFPTVEVDSMFYAIQSPQVIEKWIEMTPASFTFVVKAYQGITGHLRGENPYPTKEAMFTAFETSILAFGEKLGMILCQFPPWFTCEKQNVDYIRYLRERYKNYPLAVEFRHQSWYKPEFREKTLSFLHDHHLIHGICDEPQAGEGSIPFVPISTTKDSVLVRLHGRNVYGWNSSGKPNWREVRYLYDYSISELKTIEKEIRGLTQSTENVYVLFNNNSGGHAAANAKSFMELADITYTGLADKQLDLFSE